jgi:hypothetical protein
MDKYRVTVIREGATEDETLFELAGSAALVAKIAPGVVADALLRADIEDAGGENGRLADRVFDDAVAAGNAAQAQAEAPETTKRKRRTKAEIAADDEAKRLGFRDAAHRAEAERAADESRADAATAPATAAAPAPANYAPPAGAAQVTVPYNPFAQ